MRVLTLTLLIGSLVSCGKDIRVKCDQFCFVACDQCNNCTVSSSECASECTDDMESESLDCVDAFVELTDCWRDSSTCAAPECYSVAQRFDSECS